MSKMRIAHLSDPHFGTILPGVRESLLQSLKELKPDLILLTGDITQRARQTQFAEAREFTTLCPAKVIAIPGNHDIPLLNFIGRVTNPYFGFQKIFKFPLAEDFWKGNILVNALNSTTPWRHVQGEMKNAYIQKHLSFEPEKPKIRILAFHHPMDCAKNVDEKNLLVTRKENLPLFESLEVDLVLGGHIHDPFTSISTERFAGARPFVIGVAGTCLSSRVRSGAPNSFNLIDVDSDEVPRLSITRYDHDLRQNFLVKSSSSFVRTSRGWATGEP